MRKRLAFAFLSLFAPFGLAAQEIQLVPFEVFIPNAAFSPQSEGVDRPLQAALTSEQRWRQLWREIQQRTRDEEESLPKIDWERNTLLVVALGARPSGGYGIGFQSIREFPDAVHVEAYELTPGEDCVVTTVLTHPIAYALIQKTQKPVRFLVAKASVSCSQ